MPNNKTYKTKLRFMHREFFHRLSSPAECYEINKSDKIARFRNILRSRADFGTSRDTPAYGPN